MSKRRWVGQKLRVSDSSSKLRSIIYDYTCIDGYKNICKVHQVSLELLIYQFLVKFNSPQLILRGKIFVTLVFVSILKMYREVFNEDRLGWSGR